MKNSLWSFLSNVISRENLTCCPSISLTARLIRLDLNQKQYVSLKQSSGSYLLKFSKSKVGLAGMFLSSCPPDSIWDYSNVLILLAYDCLWCLLADCDALASHSEGITRRACCTLLKWPESSSHSSKVTRPTSSLVVCRSQFKIKFQIQCPSQGQLDWLQVAQ